MGNSSKRPEDYDVVRSYRPEEWTSFEKRSNYEIWQNRFHNIKADVYSLKNDFKTSDLDHYEMRHNNSQDIVKVHNISMDKESSLCSKSADNLVLVERIPYRLNEIGYLSQPEALSVLRSSYSGFNTLSNFYGPVQPYEDLICFNQQGKTKVWVNSNLSLNGRIAQKQANSGIIANKNASYINKILDIVERKTQNGVLSEKLKNKFRTQQPKNYFEALNLVQQYASEARINIPQRINFQNNRSQARLQNTESQVQQVVNNQLSLSSPRANQISRNQSTIQYRPVESVFNPTFQSSVVNPPPVQQVTAMPNFISNSTFNSTHRNTYVTNQNRFVQNNKTVFHPVASQSFHSTMQPNPNYSTFSFRAAPPTPLIKQNTVSNVSIRNNGSQVRFVNSPTKMIPTPDIPLSSQFQRSNQKINFQSPSKVSSVQQVKPIIRPNINNITEVRINNYTNNQINNSQPQSAQKLPQSEKQILKQIVQKPNSVTKINEDVNKPVPQLPKLINQRQKTQQVESAQKPAAQQQLPGQPQSPQLQIQQQIQQQGQLRSQQQNQFGPQSFNWTVHPQQIVNHAFANRQQQYGGNIHPNMQGNLVRNINFNQNILPQLRLPQPQGASFAIVIPRNDIQTNVSQPLKVAQQKQQKQLVSQKVQETQQASSQKPIKNQDQPAQLNNLNNNERQLADQYARSEQNDQQYQEDYQEQHDNLEENQQQTNQQQKQQQQEEEDQVERHLDRLEEQKFYGQIQYRKQSENIQRIGQQNQNKKQNQQVIVNSNSAVEKSASINSQQNNQQVRQSKEQDKKLQLGNSANSQNAQLQQNSSNYFPFSNQLENSPDQLKRVTTIQIKAQSMPQNTQDKNQHEAYNRLQVQNLNKQSAQQLNYYEQSRSEVNNSGVGTHGTYQYEFQNRNYQQANQEDRIPDNARYEDIETYIRNKYRTYIGVDDNSERPSSSVSPYAGYTNTGNTRTSRVDVGQMASYVESKYDQYANPDVQFSFRPTDHESVNKDKHTSVPSYDFMRVQQMYDEIKPSRDEKIEIVKQYQTGYQKQKLQQKKQTVDDDMLDVKNMERSLDKKYNSMKSNQQIKQLDALKKQQKDDNQLFDVKKLQENLVRFEESRVGSGNQPQTSIINSEPRFQTSQVSKIHSIDERLAGNRRSSMNRDFKDAVDMTKYSYENQSPIYEFGRKSRTSKVSKEILDIDEKFNKYVKSGTAGISSSKQILKPKQDNYNHRQYDYDSSSRMATGHFGNVESSKVDDKRGYDYGLSSKNYKTTQYEDKKTTFITSQVRSPKGITYEDLRKFMWS